MRCTAITASHAGDVRVPQNPGVVHQHVEPPEFVDGLIDDALSAVPVRDVVGVGDGPAAGSDDLVDHLVRGPGVRTLPGVVPAEVVDDDGCALLREQQRMLAPDAAAGAGDDGDPAL